MPPTTGPIGATRGQPTSGILGYGTYLPYWRMQRSAIGEALEERPTGGTRSVASFDEDTTSMGVEAARAALATRDGSPDVCQLFFATTAPAYLDKTNATAVHAALGLDANGFVTDMVGSVRSGLGALRAALRAAESTLAVAADIRTGLPGSADEAAGGDAANALLCGTSGEFIAECIGSASVSAELLDRWRTPGETTSRLWEERFAEHTYVPAALDALDRGLKDAQLQPDDIGHLIVTGTPTRAVARTAGALAGANLVDDLTARVGNTGAAHPGLLLASVLDRAGPEEVIVVLTLADGADCLVFRTTDQLAFRRQPVSVTAQLDSTRDDLPYARFLTWRGQLRREPPRRPEPSAPAAPPALRYRDWKFALVGARCECGTRQAPPVLVCWACGAVAAAAPERLAGAEGTIVTFSVDHLAFSPSPPMIVAAVDLSGGGRYLCELTDADPDQVAVGLPVEVTFRRLFTASNGVHNYFWKARPLRGATR